MALSVRVAPPMKTAIHVALMALLALFIALSVMAAPIMAPTTAKGVQVITVEQARHLVGVAQFFDQRIPFTFGKGHITGASSLPYVQRSEKLESFDPSKDSFDLARLPADKSLPIVFYSDGPDGWKSYKAAVAAARAGYSNVKWMREGIAIWVEKGIVLE
jgi:rhodanese-related sulfurtransferase